MYNTSHESEDSRTITRIIFEKATFGAIATSFKIHGDDRSHPVMYTKHPELASVTFSDGSTIIVSQPPAKKEVDRDPIKELYDDTRPTPAYTGTPTFDPSATLHSAVRESDLTDEQILSSLGVAVTQELAVETGVDNVGDVDDTMAVTAEQQSIRAMAGKLSPREEYKEVRGIKGPKA